MATDNNITVTGDDIARLVMKIEQAITGEPAELISAACLVVSMVVNKHEASLPELIEGVRRFSSEIIDYLHPDKIEPADRVVAC